MEKIPDILYFTLAGFNIEINFKKTLWFNVKEEIKSDIIKAFKKFVSIKKPHKIDFWIEFKDGNIFEVLFLKKDKHNFINIFSEKNKDKIVCYYKISVYQFQLILRYILEKLLTSNNGFILHGAACKLNTKAVLLLGETGSGKSTAIRLVNEKYRALADDSVILKKEGGYFYFHTSPFYENEWWIEKKPEKYLISKIFFLRKANFFKIEKIRNKEQIFQRMIGTVEGKFMKGKSFIKYLSEFTLNFGEFYFLDFAQKKLELLRLLRNLANDITLGEHNKRNI